MQIQIKAVPNRTLFYLVQPFHLQHLFSTHREPNSALDAEVAYSPKTAL